jgi:hypothetical protein
MMRRVAQWVVPKMDLSDGGWWIVDDTGFPKQGRHSVGVARQYCGMLGKQDNCPVAVSVSLACQAGSLPVAWQLYLPQEWMYARERCDKAGMPQAVQFATKPHRVTVSSGSMPPKNIATGACCLPLHSLLHHVGVGGAHHERWDQRRRRSSGEWTRRAHR